MLLLFTLLDVLRNGTLNYQCTAGFENLGDYFLFLGKFLYGPFLGTFLGGLDFFDP